MYQPGGRLPWFLSQTGWAHDPIIRFLSIFLGIGDEQVDARLAAEGIFFALVVVKNRLVLADSQPYQGTATCTADECIHFVLSYLPSFFRDVPAYR